MAPSLHSHFIRQKLLFHPPCSPILTKYDPKSVQQALKQFGGRFYKSHLVLFGNPSRIVGINNWTHSEIWSSTLMQLWVVEDMHAYILKVEVVEGFFFQSLAFNWGTLGKEEFHLTKLNHCLLQPIGLAHLHHIWNNFSSDGFRLARTLS